MSQTISVLLLDDGELDDVQKMLEGMRIPFARIRGASIVPGMAGPTDLLIATPRRIDAVREIREDLSEESVPVRIVVVDEDSPTLRNKLRNIGFDFIVRRPVHPEALRLMILHALYTGEEHRTEPRVPMGLDVIFKTGLRQRRATLVDLSTRGCRLLTRDEMEMDKRLRILIPEELGASEPMALRGRVVWSKRDARNGVQEQHTVAVQFEKISNEMRNELEWILEERSKGPAQLLEGGDEAVEEGDQRGILELPIRNIELDSRFEPDALALPGLGMAATAERPESAEEPEAGIETNVSPDATSASGTTDAPTEEESEQASDRRMQRRAAFEAKVPAFDSRALRVLLGRDLSENGMRVEPSADLKVGDRLHLAIYGEPTEEPFLVWAKVAREDADGNLAIAFEPLHAVVAQRLEKLVASLPAVESLHDDESEAMGTVVTQILRDSSS